MKTKHQMLFTDIQNKILSGEWYHSMLMPTENELCQMYAVSRITVRRALDDLERIGLINRIQGKGSFVSHEILRSGESQKGFSQHLGDLGIRINSVLLEKEFTGAPQDVSRRLRLPGGTPVWHFSRLRLIGDKPVAIMNTYVAEAMGRAMLDYNLEEESFYHLYEKISGKPVAATDGTITAIIPKPELCDLLKVEPGSAHIWYKSVGYLEGNEPAEVNYSIFNANLYEFSVSMSDVRIMEVP
ncbi:GntR family transcriptional regulator [Breznakiella homolactica]|uniref:GntR family transcriptional regulator n=1 Tax=Breznakiella homolactica TaxID=2798577 RepID=A0A7T8B9E4_9SPIR|nr:GntR family transcriptional regulator [Breznakiella homolactica]QQO08372.1 GntR family transcriptional regulator [Breznakiella homolactica]